MNLVVLRYCCEKCQLRTDNKCNGCNLGDACNDPDPSCREQNMEWKCMKEG